MGCSILKKVQNKEKMDKKQEQLVTEHKDIENMMEDIMDIKSVQFLGDMLFSETKGKPTDHYEIYENISNGPSFSIKRVKSKLSNVVRSMKVIKKAYIDIEEDRKLFMKEMALLRTMDHPNVLKIFEFYQDEKAFYLISELTKHGDLFDKINKKNGPFDEFTASYIVYQILSAILFCHSNNIVHRDIKAESILIESIETEVINNKEVEKMNIKLSDFSCARSFSDGKKLTKKMGTVSILIVINIKAFLHCT